MAGPPAANIVHNINMLNGLLQCLQLPVMVAYRYQRTYYNIVIIILSRIPAQYMLLLYYTYYIYTTLYSIEGHSKLSNMLDSILLIIRNYTYFNNEILYRSFLNGQYCKISRNHNTANQSVCCIKKYVTDISSEHSLLQLVE